ncbi:MAG: hypothetical protein A2Z72_03015 [Omnitrophica bacterium RBG_13_46_9]|nr:MAG: hypothetical protein A2Z72_03015 [Omnitrophica bacterium RBG_13_46_9]
MSKVIFIDRDGVINRDPGGWTEHSYVTRWEDFIFMPNAISALKRLNESGFEIVVISNQAGVSKRYYTKKMLGEINKKMIEKIKKNGAKIKKVYYCTHQRSDNCGCRKPKIGLFKQAEKDLGVRASGKFMIGDGKMDIEAARSMGLKAILVLSGKTDLEEVDSWKFKPDFIFKDLAEAVEFVIGET